MDFFRWNRLLKRNLSKKWGVRDDTFKSSLAPWAHFKLTARDSASPSIDDHTWDDLDLEKVYDDIDVCMSPIGRQVLYCMVRGAGNSCNYIDHLYDAMRFWRTHDPERLNAQTNLFGLRGDSVSNLSPLLFSTIERLNIPVPVLFVVALTVPLALLYSIFVQPVYTIVFGGAMLNFILGILYSSKISKHASGMSQLYGLLRTEKKLSRALNGTGLVKPGTQVLGTASSDYKYLLAGFDSTSDNLLVALMANALNILFLHDIVVYNFFVNKINTEKPALREAFKFVGEVDSSIALASYSKTIPHFCKAECAPRTRLDLRGLYHPLVDNPVTNDFRAEAGAYIVTGSNMAGKTTFIKAIGLNIIFAKNLGICFATSASVPRLYVSSCIEPKQSIELGKSTYSAEAERLNQMLHMEHLESSCVLIDEILSGTNTIERIAAAAAILDALAARCLVFATTHDIEVPEFTRHSFQSVHFSETGDLAAPFDFRLKAGPVRTRNAIKSLENFGFPANVVERARSNLVDVEAIYPHDYRESN